MRRDMNEWFSDTARWIYGGVLLLMTAIGWWVQRQIGRLDDQEDRIEELEKDHVTRREVREMQQHIDASIRSSEDRLANRIDKVYEKLN